MPPPMKRDIKVNFSAVDSIADGAGKYSAVVESMLEAVNRTTAILQTDAGQANAELRALREDLAKDLNKCYTTLNSLRDVFAGYSYDMQSYVRPVNAAQMVRVDRDDIWKNKLEIGWACDRVGNLSWRYRGRIHGTWDILGKQTDAERAAEENNYRKITHLLDSVIPGCAKKLKTELEYLDRIYTEKIIPFENTDDDYATKAKELYKIYKELKWYQEDWAKILIGAVIIAGLIAVTVATGGAAGGILLTVHGIASGALTGALIGGGLGLASSGVIAYATGGDVVSAMADGFMWGVIGGAISGGSGAAAEMMGGGYLVTAGLGGAENTLTYVLQQSYNDEQITLGGIAMNFGFGAVSACAGKYVMGKLSKTKAADDVIGDIGEFNIEEIRPQLKTNPDEAFFWSGRTDGVGGADVAANIAEGKGGVTLESTIANKKITMPEWEFNNPSSMEAWDLASGAYAEQVSGEIRAVVGSELRPGNIWENVELPRLIENPNVTKITTIDPKTGVETIIFER